MQLSSSGDILEDATPRKMPILVEHTVELECTHILIRENNTHNRGKITMIVSQKHNELTLKDHMKMEKINYPQACFDNEAIVTALHKTKEQVDIIEKIVRNGGAPNQKYIDIFRIDTQQALLWWTRNTYVGQEKTDQIKMAFQEFYQSLYQLLLTFKNSNIQALREFADEALYQGVAYRWLGYGTPCDSMKTARKVIGNNIYVSWSKKSNAAKSIKDKLCGTITEIACEISGEYYAIDLMAFFKEPINNEEEEIVFPTIKNLIIKTEVIPYPSDMAF